MRLAGLLLCVLASTATAQQPAQSLRGTVRDTAGNPLAGADVLLGSRHTVTGPAGGFRIDSLRPGQYALTIRLPGFSSIRSKVAVVASEPTELDYFMMPAPFVLPTIVVESRRTGIYGTVGDTAYRAAPGAKVQVIGALGGTTFADSLGKFGFPNADRGVYMVRVTKPGYLPRQIVVDVPRGEGRELAILLAPGLWKPSNREEWGLDNLRGQLLRALRRQVMTRDELERYGSLSLCDIPRIRAIVGDQPEIRINGTQHLPNWPLCAFRADEVGLLLITPGMRSTDRGVSRRGTGSLEIWERR